MSTILWFEQSHVQAGADAGGAVDLVVHAEICRRLQSAAASRVCALSEELVNVEGDLLLRHVICAKEVCSVYS